MQLLIIYHLSEQYFKEDTDRQSLLVIVIITCFYWADSGTDMWMDLDKESGGPADFVSSQLSTDLSTVSRVTGSELLKNIGSSKENKLKSFRKLEC